MPACFLLVITKGRTVDAKTHNESFQEVVQGAQVPALLSAGVLPLQIHCYVQFVPEELGKQFEFQLVWTRYRTNEIVGDATAAQTLASDFDRLRLHREDEGFTAPPEFGAYALRFRVRATGGEWRLDPLAWPFDFSARA